MNGIVFGFNVGKFKFLQKLICCDCSRSKPFKTQYEYEGEDFNVDSDNSDEPFRKNGYFKSMINNTNQSIEYEDLSE